MTRFSPNDAIGRSTKAKSPKQRRLWAEIANAALDELGDSNAAAKHADRALRAGAVSVGPKHTRKTHRGKFLPKKSRYGATL
jgi:hypothetical protein